MRAKASAAVKREFQAQLGVACPAFQKDKTIKGPPVFAWRTDGKLTFFLMLVIDTHWEIFTIEVGWSPGGTFPWRADLFESPYEWTGKGKRFRLVRLWDETRADYWWELAPKPGLSDIQALLHPPAAETLLPKVPPLVKSAVDRIRTHAMPYFEEVRRARRGDMPERFRVARPR